MANNPQERYDTPLETRTLDDGRVVYRSLRPKSLKPNPTTDLDVTAKLNTRMDVLAQEAFRDSNRWWQIAAVNGSVNGSLYFRPGTKIIIPLKK